MKCRSRSLAIDNDEFIVGSTHISSKIINWIATDTIGNYYLSKGHAFHIKSSSVGLQQVLKMSSSSMNASGRRWHHLKTARAITSRLTAAHSLLMRHFSLFTYDFKKYKVAAFQCFCGLSDFLSWRMHYPVWIHCCQGPDYDFCISQGSVATTLKWGSQNYRLLHQLPS